MEYRKKDCYSHFFGALALILLIQFTDLLELIKIAVVPEDMEQLERQEITRAHYIQQHGVQVRELIPQYVHPLNKTLKGKAFNLQPDTAKVYKFLMANLEKGVKVEGMTMEVLHKSLTLVTAISSNHFNELMTNLGDFYKKHKNVIIVYDIGLTSLQIRKLQRQPFVFYRKMNFSMYPSHVRNIQNYAFKFLIIQEVLAETGAVLWMDSSVLIKNNFSTLFKELIAKKNGVIFYLSLASHTISSATHPDMLQYFPVTKKTILLNRMLQAGGTVLLNKEKVRKNILKWAILCSSDVQCIAPNNSDPSGCRDKKEPFPNDHFGGCHRFDQSMISILVENLFKGEEKSFVTENPFAELSRM